jgi:hypothetical protein
MPTALAPAMAGAAVTARARMINAQATAAAVEVVSRCVTFCADCVVYFTHAARLCTLLR